MDFVKVNKESFRECIPYLQDEKINEYGFTPTCVYAPIDNAYFAKRDEYYVLRFEDNMPSMRLELTTSPLPRECATSALRGHDKP